VTIRGVQRGIVEYNFNDSSGDAMPTVNAIEREAHDEQNGWFSPVFPQVMAKYLGLQGDLAGFVDDELAGDMLLGRGVASAD
jgi:hypothetical protein